MVDIVNVALGSRSYDIKIGQGLLAQADEHLAPFIHDKHVIIIADTHTKALYQEDLASRISGLTRRLDCLSVPAGESSKSLACYSDLMESILALGVDRRTVLIALGGGVIGDLVGFAAASLLRGVDFIQIPTSLLAQVDSSVGGKTGINARVGKNLIGAFFTNQKLVLADSDVLRTLPEREMRAGYAEIVKYGLLGDSSFFEWLEANGADVIHGEPDAIAHAVRTSCLQKQPLYQLMKQEAGKRALNLGHTFAHAFEAEAGYDGRLLHLARLSLLASVLLLNFLPFLTEPMGKRLCV